MVSILHVCVTAMAVGLSMAAPAPAGATSEAVVEPLPMADVALAGEWKEMEQRNKDVLLSLNMTRWACHFTTAANLTACVAAESRWLTFVKNKTGGYDEKLGFIGAGNDVKPPTVVTATECQAFCSKTTECAAYTFQESAAQANISGFKLKCYWKTSAGAFTPSKQSNCIAPGGQGKPSCAPLPGEMGLGGYYGHYQGHWLSATAFLYNTTGDAAVKATAAASVATFGKVMEAWKDKYGYDGYLFPYDPIVWDKLLSGRGAEPYYTVPFYTLHKLMAGLLDQWLFANNAQAFELVQKMAGWVHGRVETVIAGGGNETVGMAMWQKVLGTEWGGMNDVLYNLYEHTGDKVYLATARRFNAYVFTARLAAGEDDLGKLPFPHANFHLPEVVGNARAYQITGNKTDKAIVDTFLDVLLTNHSYGTGGSNSGECWQEARDLGNFLTSQTEESCTQYNVLKVARRSFITSADVTKADFYERAILNGIVGNQDRTDPNATSYIYMQPLGGASLKPWGKSDYGFPCCWGTLSESFAKLGDSVFFWQPPAGSASGAVYINQFVSATAALRHLPGGVSITQDAGFPIDPATTTKLTVNVPAAAAADAAAAVATAEFAVMLRVPSWAKSGKNAVTVNGKPVTAGVTAGSYLKLEQPWKNGDVIAASFPLTLWTDPLNDYHPEHNATLAFMYGPLVLAGVYLESDIWVPKGGTAGAKADPSTFITRNSTTTLDFEAVAANGTKIRMIPLKDVTSERYVAYFMTAGTKPAQPRVYYCPHSAREHDHDHEMDADLVSAGPPSTPTPPTEQQLDQDFPSVSSRSRGVSWTVVDGRLTHAEL